MLQKIKQLLGRKSSEKPVSLIAERFKQVFNDHGVKTYQIPRLLPGIELSDLQSNETLVAVLNHSLLDKVAKLFGIRLEWLEGVDDRIYAGLHTYKEPILLLELIARLPNNDGKAIDCPLQVLTTSKQLNRNSSNNQYLIPVVVEKIADVGDEEIYRYYVFQDGYYWQHQPARIELKAIAKIIHKNICPVPLLLVGEDDMQQILDGKMVPRPFLHYGLCSDPSLEDYSLTLDQSQQAKEVDELPAVLQYIEATGLSNFEFDRSTLQEQEEQLVESVEIAIVKTQTGKQAEANKTIWEPVVHCSKALWDQEKITITAMVAIIKKTPSLKASKFSDSAIRKHISPYAPVGIAGKRGRKPKKIS